MIIPLQLPSFLTSHMCVLHWDALARKLFWQISGAHSWLRIG